MEIEKLKITLPGKDGYVLETELHIGQSRIAVKALDVRINGSKGEVHLVFNIQDVEFAVKEPRVVHPPKLEGYHQK